MKWQCENEKNKLMKMKILIMKWKKIWNNNANENENEMKAAVIYDMKIMAIMAENDNERQPMKRSEMKYWKPKQSM